MNSAVDLLIKKIKRSLGTAATFATVGWLGIQPSLAASLTLSGQCGLILNRNSDGFEVFNREISKTGVGSVIAGIMNFDTLSGHVIATVVDNYGLTEAINRETQPMPIQISISPSVVTGIYILTLAVQEPNGISNRSFNLIPTNGSKTLLLKSIAGPEWDDDRGTWTGICSSI